MTNHISLIKRIIYACIREELIPYKYENNTLTVEFSQNHQTLIAKDVEQYQLKKFKFRGDVFLNSSGQSKRLENARELLDLIYSEVKDTVETEQWNLFVKELYNCLANESLVSSFTKRYHPQLEQKIKNSPHDTFIDYLCSEYTPDEKLIFFEAWASKGHPYHPCHKTKLGFDEAAYLKFSPEFNEDIELLVGAIDKSITHLESELDNFNYHDWFSATFPDQWNLWSEKLQKNGYQISDFYPIFVHPWQYEHTHKNMFCKYFETKQLQIFEDVTITTKATLSFRTMMVKGDKSYPHIKLPVAVHSTSALRTISPMSVQNGPKLGRVLKEIVQKEGDFNNKLKLSYETCGLHIKDENKDIAKHLGVIYRSNPTQYVTQTELPIVVAALFESTPITNQPLFIDLMEKSGATSLDEGLKYFDEYSQIVLDAYFKLFLIYGIALEGHQQNTITVFENNKLKYVIARDLGGLRIHGPTLKACGFDYKAHPNSATISDDRQETTNKFLHTVLQYHLGEIILLLAEHFKVSENVFWQVLKTNLEKNFDALKSVADPVRWKDEYESILTNNWQIKSLMRMRLSNVYSDYLYVNLQNPLCETV